MEAHVVKHFLRYMIFAAKGDAVLTDLVLHNPPAAGIVILREKTQSVHFLAVIAHLRGHRRFVQYNEILFHKSAALIDFYEKHTGSPFFDICRWTNFFFQGRQIVVYFHGGPSFCLLSVYHFCCQ